MGKVFPDTDLDFYDFPSALSIELDQILLNGQNIIDMMEKLDYTIN